MKEVVSSEEQIHALRMKQKKEAWIMNVIRKLGYTREQAEKAYDRIQPYK